jgi:hypothetical protein
METVYVYREDLEIPLDVQPTAYLFNEIDKACRSGSRAAEGFLRRIFYPEVKTRYFPWPSPDGNRNKIYFDERSLISPTAIISDGYTFIQGTDYYLEPDANESFDYIELNNDSSASFAGGPQRAVSIAGLWGYSNNETTVGVTLATIDTDDTTVNVNAPIAVGMVLRIESERVRVTGRRWLDSGQGLADAMTADDADVTLAVTDGSAFTESEIILVDSERMQISEIAGNNLTVRRAVQGSVLAEHLISADVYWRHTAVIERGALGTTAASHTAGATVRVWDPPSMVRELSTAYAMDAFLQRNSGYARTTGEGETTRETGGRGIRHLEKRAMEAIGRKTIRHRAV